MFRHRRRRRRRWRRSRPPPFERSDFEFDGVWAWTSRSWLISSFQAIMFEYTRTEVLDSLMSLKSSSNSRSWVMGILALILTIFKSPLDAMTRSKQRKKKGGRPRSSAGVTTHAQFFQNILFAMVLENRESRTLADHLAR